MVLEGSAHTEDLAVHKFWVWRQWQLCKHCAKPPWRLHVPTAKTINVRRLPVWSPRLQEHERGNEAQPMQHTGFSCALRSLNLQASAAVAGCR
jgi:hypothetical protein